MYQLDKDYDVQDIDHAPKAWERQDTDTPKAFEAFAVYRNMGSNRSLRKVAVYVGKETSLIERWSSQYAWVDRVAEYDDYIADIHRDMLEQKRIEVETKHVVSMIAQTQTMMKSAIDEYAFHAWNVDAKIKHVKLMSMIDSLLRRQLGMPDKYTQSQRNVTIEGNVQIEIVNKAINALREAGINPVDAFQEMINNASQLKQPTDVKALIDRKQSG